MITHETIIEVVHVSWFPSSIFFFFFFFFLIWLNFDIWCNWIQLKLRYINLFIYLKYTDRWVASVIRFTWLVNWPVCVQLHITTGHRLCRYKNPSSPRMFSTIEWYLFTFRRVRRSTIFYLRIFLLLIFKMALLPLGSIYAYKDATLRRLLHGRRSNLGLFSW